MTDPVLNLLRLGRRAGSLVSGDVAVRTAVSAGNVKLLILALDAAEKTKQVFKELAGSGNIPVIGYSNKDELGTLLDKPPRSILAVTDINLVKGILEALERGEVH